MFVAFLEFKICQTNYIVRLLRVKLATAFQTLYFGRVFPARKSTACATPGKSRIVDKPGIWRPTVNYKGHKSVKSYTKVYSQQLTTTGKKFPNRLRNPNASIHIPTKPHLKSTKAMPRKKQIVPRILSRLDTEKNKIELYTKSEIENCCRKNAQLDWAYSPCEKIQGALHSNCKA